MSSINSLCLGSLLIKFSFDHDYRANNKFFEVINSQETILYYVKYVFTISIILDTRPSMTAVTQELARGKMVTAVLPQPFHLVPLYKTHSANGNVAIATPYPFIKQFNPAIS